MTGLNAPERDRKDVSDTDKHFMKPVTNGLPTRTEFVLAFQLEKCRVVLVALGLLALFHERKRLETDQTRLWHKLGRQATVSAHERLQKHRSTQLAKSMQRISR